MNRVQMTSQQGRNFSGTFVCRRLTSAVSDMSDRPKVVCEKPKLPTLWLDTSVVIKLTKVERGEQLQKGEVDRLTRLRTLAHKLVPAGKLIFPQSDQEEEY